MRVDRIGFEFIPRDVWIGLYIGEEKYPLEGGKCRSFFLCLIPMVVFRFRVKWAEPKTVVIGYDRTTR